jgi:hypothetical protein
MRKFIAVVAVLAIVAAGFAITPANAGPGFFKHLNRTFLFKTVALFAPNPAVYPEQSENHFKYSMKNVIGKTSKFQGMMNNLGPTKPYNADDKTGDWEIVEYCFSDACYNAGITGTTGKEKEAGFEEAMTALFSPHSIASAGKFGMMGTGRVDVWPINEKGTIDSMYFGVMLIPFTVAKMQINNTEVKLTKVLTWDIRNKDKAKRYPMTDSTDTLKVPPVILKGSTYLPMRDMAEKVIGKDFCKVGWDAATKTASYTFEYQNVYYKISLPLDKTTVTLELKTGDGKIFRDNVTVSTPATNYKGSTVVPVRLVSELMGAKVSYEASTKTVTVSMPETISE